MARAFFDCVDDNFAAAFDGSIQDPEAQALERYQKRGGLKGLQSRFNPFFQDVLKTADQSLAAHRELETALPELLQRIETAARLEQERKTNKTVDTSMGLALDKSTSNQRLRPFWSPKRPPKQSRTGKGPNSPN